jgi:hypothetical protein
VDSEPGERIKDMDYEGVDVNLTLPSGWFGTWTADDDVALEMAMYRAYHRWMADYCGVYPNRLGGEILAGARDIDGALPEIRRWGRSSWAWGLMVYAPVGMPLDLDPLPSGWRHRKFWTRSPMTMASAVKDGVPSMRFETHDSASMLFRDVDIDLAAYPMLAWRWYIELPIRSPLDERTREGDDHRRDCFFGSRQIVARSARWR